MLQVFEREDCEIHATQQAAKLSEITSAVSPAVRAAACLAARSTGTAASAERQFAVRSGAVSIPNAVRRGQQRVCHGRGRGCRYPVGFPHGNSCTESKRYETELAGKDGAVEIDMVINIGKALSGDWDYVEQDVKAVCDEAHGHGCYAR
jgi:deoxyribose-phosphate aldolase